MTPTITRHRAEYIIASGGYPGHSSIYAHAQRRWNVQAPRSSRNELRLFPEGGMHHKDFTFVAHLMQLCSLVWKESEKDDSCSSRLKFCAVFTPMFGRFAFWLSWRICASPTIIYGQSLQISNYSQAWHVCSCKRIFSTNFPSMSYRPWRGNLRWQAFRYCREMGSLHQLLNVDVSQNELSSLPFEVSLAAQSRGSLRL